MNKNQCRRLLHASLLIIFFCACNNTVPHPNTGEHRFTDDSYTAIILSLDTLSRPLRLEKTDSLSHYFINTNQQNNPYYYYFNGLRAYWLDHPDSARYYFGKIQTAPRQHDLELLKKYSLLQINMEEPHVAIADSAAKILSLIKTAEQNNSIFLYRCYDLFANSYYKNRNLVKAKEYSKLYYNHHPFKHTITVRLRYYDLSFLLARLSNDATAMKQHLDSGRALAVQTRDSSSLMRSYEYEAEWLSFTGQKKAAIDTSRILMHYLQHYNKLTSASFNNMALCFYRNGQFDSALFYFNKSIQWANTNEEQPSNYLAYGGLRQAYEAMGDYKNAYIALDSAMQIFGRETDAKQAAKIEEISVRYQTEKKDQTIKSLLVTNALNKKIINQERWIFIAGSLLLCTALLFIRNYYRRKLLMEKNEKLLLRNKKLELEQKTTRMQLNPHFIYNALANMQALINNNEKEKANNYLVYFSKLMRNILELNRHEFITLEDELNLIANYINLQQMRFQNSFDYTVDIATPDPEAISIPSMLLQPFVENAVEHGFKNIDYKGHLHINIKQLNTQLHINITDNGSATISGAAPAAGKKSLSHIITQERLNILFNRDQQRAYFETKLNNPAKGFSVDIFIPLMSA